MKHELTIDDGDLKAIQEGFRAAFEHSGSANAVFDREYRIVMLNRASEETLGLLSGAGIGRTPFEIFGEKQAPDILGRLERVFATGDPENHETEFSFPSGNRWFKTTYQPILDTAGQVSFVQTISLETTKERRIEGELREREELFRFLVENMQVGLVLQGPKSEMLLCNDKALGLLGLTREQLLGTTSFDPSWNVIHEDGSPFPGPTHPVPRAIEIRESVLDIVMGVYRPTTKDRVWILADAVPRLGADGSVRDVVCTFREITQRKEAEDRVKALLKEKELILKEVHHRIKNNMGSMMGLLTLQAGQSGDPEVGKALLEAAGRLRSMGLLYDKLYRGDHLDRLSLAEYIPALAGEILSVLSPGDRISLELDVVDRPLDPKTLSLLGIVLNELMTNALKYAFPEGRPGRIRIAMEAVSGGLRLTVEDDGVGIPSAQAPGKSEGFGLKLVEGLAQQLGGRFSVESAPGTRLVLDFPAETSAKA